MSNQPQTTTNASAEPRLCKMGCGFFGSGATGDCCSKCWRDLQKKQGVADAQMNEPVPDIAPVEHCLLAATQSTPMEVDSEPRMEEVEETIVMECASTADKKKKKKASYKNMMAQMLQSTLPTRDVEQEKESLRKVTGGGTFSKIDKI